MSSDGKYNALKGVEDVLPPDVYLWQKAEFVLRDIASVYGFQEIRLPVIEHTEIFSRSIGETTDIVEKEMYTFLDRAGRSVTLRPEGTASVVRAYVEHHLYNLPSPQKFFYTGPMFRYERPQKGRQRQFYQIGVEAFGAAAPEMDIDAIAMLKNFLERLGLKELRLEVNSIGCEKCRPEYKNALLDFFSSRLDDLCPDCHRRYKSNPLRILDCKVNRCIELKKGCPVVTDFLCRDCGEHFEGVKSGLSLLKIPYHLNPNMVRGLDYYTRTAFEVTSGRLGAQNAIAAGGRYDKLVEEFGGHPTPAFGFAIGMERLAALIKGTEIASVPAPKIFIAALGREAEMQGLKLAEDMRSKGVWAEPNYGSSSLKSQLRKAGRIGAEYAVIIGEDELKSGMVKWKNLRNGAQGEVGFQNISEIFGIS